MIINYIIITFIFYLFHINIIGYLLFGTQIADFRVSKNKLYSLNAFAKQKLSQNYIYWFRVSTK